MKKTVLIFARNLEWGKVKTRLAATAGPDLAYLVYEQLLHHTYHTCKDLPFQKLVYYSDDIKDSDLWDQSFVKRIQQGADLGERMKGAFADSFQQGSNAVLIIGTDCPGLHADLITEAFHSLHRHDVVIGPAADGGYYLLGMKKFLPGLFEDINWSTTGVLDQTLEKCGQLGLSYFLLQQLSDIDTEEDWLRSGLSLQNTGR